MKKIQNKTTEIKVKAWRSKTFEQALDDCTPEETSRINREIWESSHFEGWQEYAKNADEFIVISGKLFWIFKDDDGLEVLHRYEPLETSMITDDSVCFISADIYQLVGPVDEDNNLLTFVNNKKSRSHFSGKAFMTSRELASQLGFKISPLVCAVS